MPAKPLRIVFFGDSICAGQGVSLHRGWVARISAQVAEISKHFGQDIVVVNSSVNGNTSRQALERMPYDVQSHPLDILIVQFGMNDCNLWQSDRGHPRVSSGAFAANLEEIVHRGLTFGASAIFLITNHPTGRTIDKMPFSTQTYEDMNSAYNEIIRTSAKKMESRVKLIDINKKFEAYLRGNTDGITDFVLEDLLHLSEKGHDIYFEEVMPSIEKAISDIISISPKVKKVS
jgi:lysophospholipase L1-like esterase